MSFVKKDVIIVTETEKGNKTTIKVKECRQNTAGPKSGSSNNMLREGKQKSTHAPTCG